MYKLTKSKILNLFIVFTMLIGFVTVPTKTVSAEETTYVVISEVYGGGGNKDAKLKNDFIELYNPTESDINLEGWKVQYASKNGNFSNETALTGMIKAGGYYIIKEAAGSGGTEELPTPDAEGNIAMAATDCKVRLVDNSTNVIDLVGVGIANESETAPTIAMSNTTSVQRKDNDGSSLGETNGWDTNNNNLDFYSAAPTPRNSSYGKGENPDPEPPIDETIVDIAVARKVTSEEIVKVKGIVTFKEVSGSSFNYALQDGTAGIALRGKAEFNIGDEVIVEGKVTEFNGLVQIGYTSSEVESSENTLPKPKEVTITDIMSNNGGENYESQRVKLSNVIIGEVNTSGNTSITDSENNVANIYKSPILTDITAGDKVDIIGICSQFNTYQIRVNQADDIVKSNLLPEEDKVGPEFTVVSPANLTTTNKMPKIEISFKDESEINKDSLNLKIDDMDVTSKVDVTDKNLIYIHKEELAIGKHKLYVELADILGNTNILEVEFEVKEKVNVDGLTPYFGQLHSHTNISDGSGSIEDAYKYAKEESGVDFLAVTDHSNSLDNDTSSSMADGSKSTEWVNAHNVAKKYTDENFLGVYGYEMTWSNGTGHINTFNTPGFESRNKAGLTNKDANALENYYGILKQHPESVSQWNHPGKTFGDFNDFSLYDEQIDNLITLIEVGNGEGAVRGSGYFPSYEYYTRALDKGWHVAPANNQDNHKGKWGNANTARTVVLTDSLNEENLYDALRNMRTYSTEDENLSIIYTLNNEVMGSILSDKPESVNIKVDIKDEDNENIGKVSVVVNGGYVLDSKIINSNEEVVEFTLPADYSYYYIRVDQEDKDIAVTAPVWIGSVDKSGISKTEASTTMPIKGEELEIETSLYNNEKNDLVVESIEYSIDGKVINNSTDKIVVNSLSTASYSFKYTPEASGNFNLNVNVKATLNGVEKIYTDVLKLTVVDPSIISKVVIDATHFNDYVAGYYANNMGNFTAIANLENVAVNVEKNKITDELLKNVQLLIISAPAKKAGNVDGANYSPQVFSDEFIQTVKRYAENGGDIIVCGLADYQDGTEEYASSTQLNKLLETIGVTTRINNDEVVDKDNNAGQEFRLKFKNINMDSEFLNGVVSEQEYSFYSGCSVQLDEKAVKEGKANWLVKGFDTTYSFDSNKNTIGVSIPKGEVVALATEKLSGGGNIFIGGTVFMSDFEVQASLDNYGDLQYSNYNIVKNILEDIKKDVKITPIKDVRTAEMGEVFTIEAYVTAGTQEGNAFFDTIYVQDETAGINIFPVANIDLKVGQKVRITGTVSAYEGEKQLNLTNIKVIDDSITEIIPKVMSTNDATSEENKGSLVSVTGKVKSIGKDNSGYMILNDGSGDVRVFLNGYIGASDGSLETGKFNPNIKVGDTVTAIGLTSTDTEGARIRVRDSAEVVISEDVKENKDITIFHTNDTHGRVKADNSVVGIDTISAIKKSVENSLLIDAGDTLHGLPFATMNKGADIIDLMKLAGYDLMAPGNHDFNYGYERLLELADQAKADNGFDIISANVLKDGKSILEANNIKEINGIKVGFFGLTSPETTYKTNPNNVKGLEFADPIKIAKDQVKALKESGAEIIIAIAHIGVDESTEITSEDIAKEVDGIDVIIDGHSHSKFENGFEAENDTLIVSTGEYEGNLGKLTLTVNTDTKKLVEKKATLINKKEALEVTADPVVTAKIKEIDEEQKVILSEVIGTNITELDGKREHVRAGETNLGNLLTDAMLNTTGAEIAITNGGGIRASIDVGEITKGEVIGVLPFGNFIVTKYLTGKQIKDVIEHGVKDAPNVAGQFPHVGGIKYVYDPTQPVGSRVVNITLNGEKIKLEKEYLVATNDFISAGGDGYPHFSSIKTENEFSALDEALADYIKELKKVDYELEGRILVGTAEEIENQEKADAVIEVINGIPKLSQITLENIDMIRAARKAYDELTSAQKELVPKEVVDKLIEAEAKIAELEKEDEKPEIPVDPEKPSDGNNNNGNDNQGNEEGKGDLPQTGGVDSTYFLIFGLLMITTGAIVVLEKKNKIKEAK